MANKNAIVNIDIDRRRQLTEMLYQKIDCGLLAARPVIFVKHAQSTYIIYFRSFYFELCLVEREKRHMQEYCDDSS